MHRRLPTDRENAEWDTERRPECAQCVRCAVCGARYERRLRIRGGFCARWRRGVCGIWDDAAESVRAGEDVLNTRNPPNTSMVTNLGGGYRGRPAERRSAPLRSMVAAHSLVAAACSCLRASISTRPPCRRHHLMVQATVCSRGAKTCCAAGLTSMTARLRMRYGPTIHGQRFSGVLQTQCETAASSRTQ